MRIIILSLVASALLASAAMAGDCCNQPACCDKSCGPCTQMTCKVVCEMKKVKKTVWVVECEQFCVANPGCKKSCCGSNPGCCEDGCTEGCDSGCGPCAELLSRPLVKPHCGKVRYRKKLIKKTITCEVPTYKCILVPCGSSCGDCCDAHENVAPKEEKSAIQPAPLPPIVRGKA